MEYTLAGAAEATGVSKTTVFRAIKSGKLPARRLDDGTFRIEQSELVRLYPLVAVERYGETFRNIPQREKTSLVSGLYEAELAVLRLKVRMLEDQLGHERETVQDLRRRLDEEQAERRTLQLRLMTPPPEGSLQEAPSIASAVDDLWAELVASEEPISAGMPQPAAEEPQEPLTAVPLVSCSTSPLSMSKLAPALGKELQELPTAMPVIVEPTPTPSMLELASAEKKEGFFTWKPADIQRAAFLSGELARAPEKLREREAFLQRLADTMGKEPASAPKGFLSRLLAR